MDPLKTTVAAPTQSTNSNPLKGKTNYQKGQHFLRLSLETLAELDRLSQHEHLSSSQKASYAEAYRSGKVLSEETIRIRDRLLTQKKPLHKFLINLFIRESSSKHFYKVSFGNYSSIKKTSDDLNRVVISEIDALLASGNLRVSTQGNQVVNEETLANVVEDNLGLSPNENIQGINPDMHTEQVQETGVAISEEDEEDDSTRSPYDVEGNPSGLSPHGNTQDINIEVHTKQGVQEALAILDRLGIDLSREEDENEEDDETIRPSLSQSRASSPGSSCTINIVYNISQSVVSFDSDLTKPTLNIGVNQGVDSVHD